MSPPKDPQKRLLWLQRNITSHTGKPSKKKNRTYKELYGEEKANKLIEDLRTANKGKIQSNETIEKRRIAFRASTLRKGPQRRQKKFERICQYCKKTFLSASYQANKCPQCLTYVKATCSCGCNESVTKQLYEVNLGLNFLKVGHFARNSKNKSSLEDLVASIIPEWERQYPIGPYQVDFASPFSKRVLEVNGCFWHCCPECNLCSEEMMRSTHARDERKIGYLTSRGWNVELLWEHNIQEWLRNKGKQDSNVEVRIAHRRKRGRTAIRICYCCFKPFEDRYAPDRVVCSTRCSATLSYYINKVEGKLQKGFIPISQSRIEKSDV